MVRGTRSPGPLHLRMPLLRGLASYFEAAKGLGESVFPHDANLPASALAFLASACTAPLMADAVSIQKAPRLLPCLHRLQAVKPNRSEAECLTNVQIRGTDGLEEAALTLLREGVENVFITLGSQGVYYMNRDTAGIQPCLSGTVVNTNGCGDAFFAAAALALSRGLPISRAALLGQACAAVCAEADSAVNPNLSLDRIERKAGLKR